MDNKTNKPPFQKKKAKAHQVAIIEDEETSDEEEIDYGDPDINAWVHKGQTLKTCYKLAPISLLLLLYFTFLLVTCHVIIM